MPRDDAAVAGRLGKDLVVPEPHPATEQLRRRNRERRMPQQVVKTRRDTPRPERMKQYARGVGRFVAVELIEKMVSGMSRIGDRLELAAKGVDLFLVEYANAREIPVLVKERHLLVGQAIAIPRGVITPWKQIGDRLVTNGEVRHHGPDG